MQNPVIEFPQDHSKLIKQTEFGVIREIYNKTIEGL